MQNLENNENELTPLQEEIVTKVTKKTSSLTSLEASIIAKSEYLNLPALASYFSVTEDEVKNALAKK
jgi:hypothetical protein